MHPPYHKCWSFFQDLIILMKLVLNFNQDIKLYKGPLTYEELLRFVQQQFRLQLDTIALLFPDDEEDLISMTSQDDLEILLAVYEGKEYAKVNVEGQLLGGEDALEKQSEINDWPSMEKVKEEDAPEVPEENKLPEEGKGLEIEVKAKEINSSKIASEPQPQPEEAEECAKEPLKPSQVQDAQESETVEEKQQIVSVKHEELSSKEEEVPKEEKAPKQGLKKHKSIQSKSNPKKIRKVKAQKKVESKEQPEEDVAATLKKLLTRAVTELVDNRVRVLLPVVKEQAGMKQQLQPDNSELVHKGYQCVGCNVRPVRGIRYECPHCIGFSLCCECEEKIPHEHNLIKIKHLKEKIPQSNAFDQLCQMLTMQQQQSKSLPKKESIEELHSNRQQQILDQNIKNAKLCYDRLTMVFGPKNSNFKPFLTEYQELTPKEAVNKFAEIHFNWNAQQVKSYELEGKIKRVGAKMGKDPEFFRKVVEEHPDEEVMQIITRIKSAAKVEARKKAEEMRLVQEEKRRQRKQEMIRKKEEAQAIQRQRELDKQAQKQLLKEKKRQQIQAAAKAKQEEEQKLRQQLEQQKKVEVSSDLDSVEEQAPKPCSFSLDNSSPSSERKLSRSRSRSSDSQSSSDSEEQNLVKKDPKKVDKIKAGTIKKVIEMVRKVGEQLEEVKQSGIKSARTSKVEEEAKKSEIKPVRSSEVKEDNNNNSLIKNTSSIKNTSVIKESSEVKKEIEVKNDSSIKTEVKLPEILLSAPEQQIYDLMLEFFGDYNKSLYPAFIKKHFKQGKERIVQMWVDQSNILE